MERHLTWRGSYLMKCRPSDPNEGEAFMGAIGASSHADHDGGAEATGAGRWSKPIAIAYIWLPFPGGPSTRELRHVTESCHWNLWRRFSQWTKWSNRWRYSWTQKKYESPSFPTDGGVASNNITFTAQCWCSCGTKTIDGARRILGTKINSHRKLFQMP